MTGLAKSVLVSLVLGFGGVWPSSPEDVVPFKFERVPPKDFVVPSQIRHTMPRRCADEPDIVYYLSRPKNTETFPIVFLLGGSYSRTTLSSIFHFHRYFLQECLDLGLGVVSLEEWGVDGRDVNVDVFMAHYTRTRRLEDYRIAIEHFMKEPPRGWNGKFVLFGISEGGPLVTRLSEEYPDNLLATINWAGAEAWLWRDEFWLCIQKMRSNFGWWQAFLDKLYQWVPFVRHIPATREEYDDLVDEMIKNPVATKEFLDFTYMYHADACAFPLPRYRMLQKPFLVVAGGLDPEISSFDDFVINAKEVGAPVTYFRVDEMGHFVRRNLYAVEKTFAWLAQQLGAASAV